MNGPEARPSRNPLCSNSGRSCTTGEIFTWLVPAVMGIFGRNFKLEYHTAQVAEPKSRQTAAVVQFCPPCERVSVFQVDSGEIHRR